MRPKILVDIKGGRDLKNFGCVSKRINLDNQRVIRIPLKSFLKNGFVVLAVVFFAFGSVNILNENDVQAAQNEEERQVLEAQLAELEKQIASNEATIEEYRKKGQTLTSEIKQLEAQIKKLNLQIKAINLSLLKLNQEITETQGQIKETESQIDINKKNLSILIQTIYENGDKGMIEVLLENLKLSDFFGDINNLIAVQDNLRIVLGEIVTARQKLVDQKEVLAMEYTDTAALKAYQDAQKANIQKTQSKKNNLLKITKGKESEYQKILVETKKSAAEIRKQIFKFIGGGELDFESAYELAKFAEKATGVRAALIMAVLDRESALGKNVGQCDYKTAMHPTRDIPIFLEIVKKLGLESNLESGLLKVSCANADGAYGGAMGPAQFIPSTWKAYENKIVDVTGNSPANPWRNGDAFVATALYLKNAGAANASLAKERKAAAKYYAGSRWSRYLWTYGVKVISQAQKFQDDIDILRG